MAHPVILFDGECNLCNGFVQFVIQRDPANLFRFTSLQSSAGAAILRRHRLPENQMTTLILSIDDRYWLKSDAALGVFSRLPGIWKIVAAFTVLPKFFRDWVYDLVAANRYRLFGRRDSCIMPTPELQARFLA